MLLLKSKWLHYCIIAIAMMLVFIVGFTKYLNSSQVSWLDKEVSSFEVVIVKIL